MFRTQFLSTASGIYHHKNHKPLSDHCFLSSHSSPQSWSLQIHRSSLELIFFLFLLLFFFLLDSGLTFSLLLPRASSLPSDTIHLPGVIFLPRFLDTFCFSTAIPQCSFKICKMESFKTPTLPSSSFMIDGNCFKIWFPSSGDMPVA